MNYLIVALFAFFGGNLRYLIGVWLPKIGVFPLGTLVANLIGCFLFSWLVKHIMRDRDINGRLILGVGTGFMGSLTTFSSFAADSIGLLTKGQLGLALLYVVASIVGGLLMVFLGEWVYRPKDEVRR